MKVSTILDQIDLGAIALPEFQRGYVWNRDQVRGLMDSLYRRHPVGSLLVWVTQTENAEARGDGPLQAGTVKLLLDGQQRITSLYGIVRGRSPRFFEGNAQAFTGLYFNLGEEIFEFYAPMKMKDNPLWISVTDLMKPDGIGKYMQKVLAVPDMQPNIAVYISRLNFVNGIKDIDLHIEEVAGEDKTVDVVVTIFNNVNSGGTKLSKGDLALAKICAQWPEARQEMNQRLVKWRNAGFDFKVEWLLRITNSVLTGEALFSALKDVDTATFREGLKQSDKYVDKLLNLISSRLGLDHDRVLGSRYSFPLMARYLGLRGGQLTNNSERDKLLYWYIHTLLWGRYAGSTESVLNQDLGFIEEGVGALDRLIAGLRQIRGDLRLTPVDFRGWNKGARFYPLMYMLTRVCHARDWGTGVELSNHLLGYFSALHLHHIFPKALLYKNAYALSEVNALANFTFLTLETNLAVSDKDPAEYLPRYAELHPGSLESHWIPMDRSLWKVDNYPEFLEARRELLARAANDFLDSLIAGTIPESAPIVLAEVGTQPVVGGVASEEEEEELLRCNAWVVEQRLPEGEFMFELTDPESGEALAVLDLAWPNGLQEELSQPVALLIDENAATKAAANRAGYLYFDDVEAFQTYVRRDILALELQVV